MLGLQTELIDMDPSPGHTPRASQRPPTGKGKSGTVSTANQEAASDAALTDKITNPDSANNAATSGAQVAPAAEERDSATSTVTARQSGVQHGMQVPAVKPQAGGSLKGALSSELGMGKRKASGRFASRQTSDELPDVTGRQSDHTTHDATGVRRISTAGRRIFGANSA